jgi:4-amino-4-deoxy-L-arabinose transferase-like glycosyltransferase
MNIQSNNTRHCSDYENGSLEQFVSKNKWIILSFISILAVCMLFINHPRSFVIADEISYYSASKALSENTSFVIETSNILSSKYPFDVFVETPAGIVSKYPPGWFSFASLFFRLLPYSYVLFLNVWIGMLMALTVFLIGQKLMGSFEGVIATSIMICSPPIMFYSNTFMSDVFSAFLIVTVVFLMLHTFEKGWMDTLKYLMAGLITGYSVSVRYSNVYIIPILICYLIFRKTRVSFKNVYAFVIGIIPPGIMLFVYQHYFFGSGLMTGYSTSSRTGNFVLTGFMIKFTSYLQAIFVSGLPIFALPAFIGLVLFTRKEKEKGLLLSALIIVPILLYSFYYWHAGDHLMILRFILPALPFLALSSAYTIGRVMQSNKSCVRWISILIVSILFINSGLKTWHALSVRFNVDVSLIRKTHQLLPEKAVVICGHTNHPSLLLLGDNQITAIELNLLDTSTGNGGGTRINQTLMQQKIPLGKGSWYDYNKAYSQAWKTVNSAMADGNLYAALKKTDLENLMAILDARQTILEYDKSHQWIIVRLSQKRTQSRIRSN